MRYIFSIFYIINFNLTVTNAALIFFKSGSLQEMSSGDEHDIGMDPITPAEVREAVRRYWANNSPLASFSKIRSSINTRLLAG